MSRSQYPFLVSSSAPREINALSRRAGEKYTIDIIDNYAGSWGWFLVNDLIVNPPLRTETMFGDATQAFEPLNTGPFAGWTIVAQVRKTPSWPRSWANSSLF